MGTHPIFESDFDCLTEGNTDYTKCPRTLSHQDTLVNAEWKPRRINSSKRLFVKSWVLPHTNVEHLNCSVSLRIRDVFDSRRNDWVLTSVPRESEKKCLESSNNKERQLLLLNIRIINSSNEPDRIKGLYPSIVSWIPHWAPKVSTLR